MSRPVLLVIEDNPLTRKMFRLVAETEGFAVVEAGDGAAALECMAAAPTDLVLLDLVIPDMDGAELGRRLRAIGGAGVRILAMSGFQGLLEDARGHPGLFDAHLFKPIEPAQLAEVLRAHVPAPMPVPAPEGPGAGGHLLVVDDDPVQLKLARIQLGRHFGRISTVRDGTSALALARSAPPDLVLSDVMMPGLDGFELCLALRQDPALAAVPVVLVSAQPADGADAELCRRVGASALLSRTSDFEDLVPTLLALLEQARAGRPAAAPSGGLGPDHGKRARRQLEGQMMRQVELGQREARLGAQLAILSGVADALGRSADVEATLSDVLAACLDAGGVECCALYRLEGRSDGPEDGRGDRAAPRLTHVLGFPEEARAALADMFGHPALLAQALTGARMVPIGAPSLSEEEARAVLTRAGVASAMLIPLLGAGRCVGALLVGMQGEPDAGQLAFGRALSA